MSLVVCCDPFDKFNNHVGLSQGLWHRGQRHKDVSTQYFQMNKTCWIAIVTISRSSHKCLKVTSPMNSAILNSGGNHSTLVRNLCLNFFCSELAKHLCLTHVYKLETTFYI